MPASPAPRHQIGWFRDPAMIGTFVSSAHPPDAIPILGAQSREHMDQPIFQRAAQLELLTETAPDTLMGTLLRSFWQPVALSDSVAPGNGAARCASLSEDLTLYRGDERPRRIWSAGAARTAARCCTPAGFEDEQIRCMYHGWRYDGTGQCTEMPAERGRAPDLSRSRAIRCHEYGGLHLRLSRRRRRRRRSICRARTCLEASRPLSSSRATKIGTATGSSRSRTRSTPCT